MTLDNLPFLMALLWQGLSLSFITMFWFQWLAPQFGKNKGIEQQQNIPFSIRIVLSILVLLGALGAATLLGRFRGEIPGTDVTFVVGLAVGVLIAVAMRSRSRSKSSA